MAAKSTVRDYVTLQRGLTYQGNLVGKPGPALLGLGSISPGGGFREGDYKTYGGECRPKHMLFPGDLYVSLKGATKDGEMIGSVARVPTSVPTGRLTQDTVGLRFKEPSVATSNYLYWILRTPQYRDYCAGRATGSAVVGLSRDDFLDFQVPEPTKFRTGIVDVLEEIERKTELNRRMNATLEAMARALFRSWFVDFDPVRAKLDGRQSPGLDQPTADLFPAAFEDSPLGPVPKGWTVGKLADICTLKRGHDLPTDLRTAGSVPVISSSGISGSHHVSKAKGPGVVTGRYGTIGKVFFVDGNYWPLNTTLYVEDFKGSPPRYVFHILEGVNFMRYTDKAAVPGVNRNHLHEEPSVLPPVECREAFTHAVSPLWSKHRSNEVESRTLAALRDALLPKLLSGELKVGSLESIRGEDD